jgi:hypothetical protein
MTISISKITKPRKNGTMISDNGLIKDNKRNVREGIDEKSRKF